MKQLNGGLQRGEDGYCGLKDVILNHPVDFHTHAIQRGLFIGPSSSYVPPTDTLENFGDATMWLYEPKDKDRRIVEKALLKCTAPIRGDELFHEVVDWTLGTTTPRMDTLFGPVVCGEYLPLNHGVGNLYPFLGSPRFPVVSNMAMLDTENTDMSYSLSLLEKHLGEPLNLDGVLVDATATADEVLAEMKTLLKDEQ